MRPVSEHPSLAPFTLVLAGGGARGYAHAGVIRTFERAGLFPSAVVGVSMGAVVAATYSLRLDWYEALMALDTSGFPGPGGSHADEKRRLHRLRMALGQLRVAWNMLTGWGAPERAVGAGRVLLTDLFGDRGLEDGRIPVVVCATDLLSGSRVELARGLASEAVYASSALAGIIPPADIDGGVLADGVYADIAPIDVARAMTAPVVIVVDPGQPSEASEIRNGAQALMRALEICHLKHAELRMQEADMVISPKFGRHVDTLDFGARRYCVAAGMRAARGCLDEVRDLLCEASRRPADSQPAGTGNPAAHTH